jgi:hypothetical protein
MSWLREYARFLRAYPWAWLAPIALTLAFLVWLASQQAGAPESPFIYRQ